MKKAWTLFGSLLLLVGANAQTKDTAVKKETVKPAAKKPVELNDAAAKTKGPVKWSYDDESPKEAHVRKLDSVQSKKAVTKDKY